MDRRNLFFVRALCATAVLGTGGIAWAGSLEPPPGPVSPTMKTLDQVEARKPIHQSDLPLAISVDGSYYLAENLYASQNGVDMIDVFAANVSIDLNGVHHQRNEPNRAGGRLHTGGNVGTVVRAAKRRHPWVWTARGHDKRRRRHEDFREPC